MRPASEKLLKSVHPLLAEVMREVVSSARQQFALTIEITQGLRTFSEQDALFAKGRTTPGEIVTRARGGESNHNYGLAVDFAPFEGGKPNWKAPVEVWTKVGRLGEAMGLEWGGDWVKLVDLPHLEMGGPSVKECQRLYAKGGLPLVWEQASKLWMARMNLPAQK